MGKLFQIAEEDLAQMEETMPELADTLTAAGATNDPMTRKRLEAVRGILSRVRWNYGPPTESETVDA